jgi:hypothetical protein
MAVDKFQIKVEQSGELAPPILTDGQLQNIGLLMVTAQKQRWKQSIDSTGATARPLAPMTAKLKRKAGRNPKRDMYMTGVTIRDFDVLVATAGVIVAGNKSSEAELHARKAQAFDEMIGLAPTDQAIVEAAVERAYEDYIVTSWRPVKP